MYTIFKESGVLSCERAFETLTLKKPPQRFQEQNYRNLV